MGFVVSNEVYVKHTTSCKRKLAAHPNEMKNRKIEIRIEKRERITFFRLPDEMHAICAACQREVTFVAPEYAAASFNTTMREIFRLIETSQIHFIEAETGQTFVCLTSLENLFANQSLVICLDDCPEVASLIENLNTQLEQE